MIHLQNVKYRQAKSAIFGIQPRGKSRFVKNPEISFLRTGAFLWRVNAKSKGFVGKYHKN